MTWMSTDNSYLMCYLMCFPSAMCPSDLQQLWKEVSGVQSTEEALKHAEGLDLSTNSCNTTSAFPKAASAHIPLHSLPNGQSHTPKRDRLVTSSPITIQHPLDPALLVCNSAMNNINLASQYINTISKYIQCVLALKLKKCTGFSMWC